MSCKMIIQEMSGRIIEKLAKKLGDMLTEIETFSSMAETVQNSMNELGISILEEMVGECNEALRNSAGRKKGWHVVRQDERKLMTPMGEVRVNRDYYRHKRTKEYAYLLDEVLGLTKNDRIDQGMKKALIEKAETSSYERASKHNSYAPVSKQTVLRSIREAGVLRVAEEFCEKRKLKYLYVEADEDHISYQDGTSGIAKLIYVHEGIERHNKRGKLLEPFHFASISAKAEEIWMEVCDYIYERYEIDEIENIYLSGDGASWIRSGIKYLPKSVFMLDRFHRNEYIKKAAGGDEGFRQELRMALDAGDKAETFTVLKEIYETAQSDTQRKRIIDVRQYFRNNWDGIEAVTRYPNVLGCSAEGHVSHILSERLSSRPKGWSRIGAEQMARLRVFVRNKGDIGKELIKRAKSCKRSLSRSIEKEIRKKVSIGFEKHDNISVLHRGKITPIFVALKGLQQTRWQTI